MGGNKEGRQRGVKGKMNEREGRTEALDLPAQGLTLRITVDDISLE